MERDHGPGRRGRAGPLTQCRSDLRRLATHSKPSCFFERSGGTRTSEVAMAKRDSHIIRIDP